jgi:transcription initiation factor TFIIIB Brf1 subunit/transcription initiation factor TFIIB
MISKYNIFDNINKIKFDDHFDQNDNDWDMFNKSLNENDLLSSFNNLNLNNVSSPKTNYDSPKTNYNDINKIKNDDSPKPKKYENDIDLEVCLNIVNIKIDYKKCPKCNIYCKVEGIQIICEKCGLAREWDNNSNNYCISFEQNYNTSNNSFMTFNMVGKNSYCYQRSLLKTCANYSSFRNNNNKKEIINKIYQYDGNKLPINICNLTAELFDQIKQKNYVFRGNGKWGVIGACLFYACIMNNLTRTPREIANIVGVEDRFLSQGDRTLQELNELGVINIPTTFKPLSDYLDQFLSALEIPIKYKQFIIDLISRAEKKHIHIGNESRTTTKCIGSIYMLCKRIPSLKHIKKDKISNECINISKSTFIRYYNLLMENPKKIKKVFKKWKIPMPVEWKNL